MLSIHEARCIREVTKVDRIIKKAGGAMRPREVVYYKCQLSCGHLGEKMKGPNQMAPPVRMTCPQCKALQPQELDA